MKKIFLIICIGLILNIIIVNASPKQFVDYQDKNGVETPVDFDPLLDINITFDVLAIRALDKIDKYSQADFYLKLTINNQEYVSEVCNNTDYLYDYWSVSKNIPDDIELVNISLQLLDYNDDGPVLCDINKQKNVDDNGLDITVYYNIKTGNWFGDDYNIGDGSGYGRACGTGDGSVYKNEKDCEIWFDIHQNDYDEDGIPYWIETNIYGTDPTVDNSGEDNDIDGVPIEWEHRWGFNPNIWEDHEHFDSDKDSITNIEEYYTSVFKSDPYRQDVFLEMDFMEDGPNGEISVVPEKAKELLKNPFHRRDIVFHIDSGLVSGGELITFDEKVKIDEVIELYNSYFLHNDEDNWRRGVFHYGLIVYSCSPPGFGFSGDIPPYWGYIPGTNGFIISSKQMEKNNRISFKTLEYFYASAIMHEMGHNFGFRWGKPFGCDGQLTKYPWQIGYWFFRNYKSIMNYRYTYKILDYSDGSHGNRDHDDWNNLDLSYFEIP